MKDELDRESLLIYLNDLRIMETIIHESDEKIKQLNASKLEQKESYNIECRSDPEPLPPKEPCVPVKRKLSRNSILSFIGGLAFICGAIFSFSCGIAFLGVIMILIGLGMFCPMIKEYLENNKVFIEALATYQDQVKNLESNRLKQKRSHELWEARRESANRKYESYRQEIFVHTHDIGQDIDFFKSKLNSAYSANIIPLQFRNIQGIYYLYDYISTSNQSLSEALMQCNLEAIKQKLDSVIELQGKAIIQQAQANAAIMEQNQRILETAQATMQNTAVAAKYAQICAVNSELSLKLQAKDLAYQKADFWLK